MSVEDLLKAFPAKRIRSTDGMAVTADVWEEAHGYHRHFQRFLSLLHNGWGIVTGLEVIASDPADTSIYILPGVAIDNTGQTIVLPQPVAYDIGRELEGLISLLLSYGESRPRQDEGSGHESSPQHVRAEFSVAARNTLPGGAWVELARVQRTKRSEVFRDAANPGLPGPNEIDLRGRREIGAPRDATVAVCYLGKVRAKTHGRGVALVAETARRQLGYFVTIQDGVPLAPGIETNTLIYLVGQGSFELSSGQVNGLSNYVRRGRGTLFIECLDGEAESAFLSFLHATEMIPKALTSGHRLLTHPFVFAVPPAGYDGKYPPDVKLSEGVILSMGSYGYLWQGEMAGATPSREQIRAALEWGCNLIAYASGRKRL